MSEQRTIDPVSYVHLVPDHCDRIIWRGRYYQLSLLTSEPSDIEQAEKDWRDGEAHGRD